MWSGNKKKGTFMRKIFFIVLMLAGMSVWFIAWADVPLRERAFAFRFAGLSAEVERGSPSAGSGSRAKSRDNSTKADVPQSRLVDFNYEVLIEGIPEQARELKVWFPYLPETPYQEIQEVNIEPQEGANISYDKTYHNRILNYMIASPQNSSLKFNVRYRVKRSEYSNKHPLSGSLPRQEDLRKYLQADQLVTISPKVKAMAKEITQGKIKTTDKARAIYNYVFQNVAYDKTIPGWGNGDTERVCLLKAGNCTDFHSLFISLARASGIPTKFVMGVPLAGDKKEGEIPGYHCWAEFYDEKLGWVPVDISEAWKNKSKYEYYFGAIGADRLEISVGRDIILEPNANTEPLNYFFYPYVEVDGKKFFQIKTSFRFKDVNMRKEVIRL
jgi:transglutaminase-like putative cysteine protease